MSTGSVNGTVGTAPAVPRTVANQLGVDYNAKLLESIVKLVAPAVGWR